VLHVFGLAIPCYAALSALMLNAVIAGIATLIAQAMSVVIPDQTVAEDYV
jgi:hypothetical protein